jgi:hypothetical protein
VLALRFTKSSGVGSAMRVSFNVLTLQRKATVFRCISAVHISLLIRHLADFSRIGLRGERSLLRNETRTKNIIIIAAIIA